MGKELKSLIATRVKAARQAKGVTQEELAEAIDRTVETISNLERGKSLPSLQTLMVIANALGITLSELLEDVEAPPSPARVHAEARLRAAAKSLPDYDLEIAAVLVEALRQRLT